MGMHDGHRERVRQRALKEGITHLDAHNVLEILLFFALPRGDTNELAHRILSRYHNNFAAVVDAPYEELLKIDGIGESTAFLLKMIPQLSAYYRTSRTKKGTALNSMESLQEYFIPMFYGKSEEEVHLVCLDAILRPICEVLISKGTVNASAINIKRIVAVALEKHAVSVILAHNHPAGVPRPSRRDEITTKEISEALKLVDVELLDHIIVADEEMCSMRESGILPYTM